jgi:peptidoglycan/xylan/chitin deacetylase (PgdA/CDA1 family)
MKEKIKLFIKNCLAYLFVYWPIRRNRAMVLMYHSISNNNDKFFKVRPVEFEKQMAYLHEFNFNVVSLATLEQYLEQGIIPPKTVILTFDDGYEDNFYSAWPILRKYNFPAAIFLTTGLTAGADKITPLNLAQMKKMAASGLVDFEPHTVNHPKLTKIDLAEAEKEIALSRDFINRQFKKKSVFFAYPYGSYNDQIIGLLKKLDFRLGFTIEKGVIKTTDNRLLLKRNSVDSAVTMIQFKALVKRGKI